MKAAVVVFPGTNCDKDTYIACKYIGWNVSYIWHKETNLKGYDCIILPGGFSYGDYIGAGRLAKFSPVMQSVKQFVKDKQGFVLGICNGFQILCESQFLPGALTYNRSGKFICDDASLSFTPKHPSTGTDRKLPHTQQITLPIAHKEGCFICDETMYETIKKKNMDILKYSKDYNGSSYNIAGLYNSDHKIMGLMPHPERAILSHSPSFDGKKIFKFVEEQING